MKNPQFPASAISIANRPRSAERFHDLGQQNRGGLGKPKSKIENGTAGLLLTSSLALTLLTTGCQVLTYSSPTGERFTRSSLGANTSIHSLSVETGTNGLRKVQLRGYQNNETEALGAVTEAAVRAAIQAK